jgi:hypothetical protein
VFSKPKVQKLLGEEFIPVAANDWYQRRRQDAEGHFFRSVAAQGPRRTEGGTRQGHYVFTAGGKLLGYNNNRDPKKRLAMMRDALKKWEALPDSEKTATIPDRGKQDAKYAREFPKGGTVVKVHSRALEGKDGQLKAAVIGGNTPLAAVDFLWLKKEEVAALHALSKSGGYLPDRLTERMARFHLNDSIRGEPRPWKRSEVKNCTLTLTPSGEVTGTILINSRDGKMGYEGALTGTISFDKNGNLQRFDLFTLGSHWGEGQFTRGARPGKSPLGHVFSLTSATKPEDQIPPQGMHWEQGYWEAEKH